MARALAIAAALAVAAWFALGVVQAIGAREAQRVVARPEQPSPAQLGDADDALDRAATLNPDIEPDVLRARLALLDGEQDRARRLLLGVVDREPQNAIAWATLLISLGRTDPALAARARAVLRRLSPPVPPA